MFEKCFCKKLHQFIAAILFMACPAFPAAGDLLINEVSPSGTSDFSSNDWVEIFVKSSGSYSGFKLWEGQTAVKTFPVLFTLSAGDYIVVHEEAGTDEDDSSGKGSNGYWDLFSCGDFTATDNVISIRDSSGVYLDAMGFSNADGTLSSTNRTAYTNIKTGLMWTDGPVSADGTNDAAVEAALPKGPGSGATVGRSSSSADTNGLADWALLASPTPGQANVSASGGTSSGGTVSALITEVAPGISGGDIIELYALADCSLNGAKLYEGSNLIKTLPDIYIKKGEYLILHASEKGTDETGSSLAAGDSGNGYWDVYSDETSPGLTGTDNNITLKDSSDGISDFMSFADDSLSYSAATSPYDAAVAASQWTPASVDNAGYIQGSVAWSGSTKGAMARKLGSTGQPLDGNSKSDWSEQSSPTPGRGYGAVFPALSGITVYQSPFSPYGDYKYTEAQIAYRTDPGSQVTLRIFDRTGRLMRTLVDRADSGSTGDSQTVPWNGLDDSGTVLPVGVYIVSLSAINMTTGSVSSQSATVILGKRLR